MISWHKNKTIPSREQSHGREQRGNLGDQWIREDMLGNDDGVLPATDATAIHHGGVVPTLTLTPI
jgi:hypothetical protein